MFNRFKGLLSKGKKGIGIELAPERINIAQLKKQGQSYKVATLYSHEVPEGIFQGGQIADSPALAELIKTALAESKIKAEQVATAVPMRESVIRIIPIPAELDDQELRDMVLNHEAGLYLPYPREEVDLDYQKLGFFQMKTASKRCKSCWLPPAGKLQICISIHLDKLGYGWMY
jgi:type IV pilus assembly protein PilM